MVIAAILAGGTGTRMGSALPKQVIEIAGVPIIIRSIQKLIGNPNVDRCVVAVGADYVDYTKELIGAHIATDKPVDVIPGGSFRGDTLAKVLAFMEENGILDSVVLTHDAVRPFIDDRIIDDNILAARGYGACNTCVPAVDTVLLSKGGRYIDFVPPRSSVFHAQTPQSFDAKRLYELIKATPPEDFRQMTDGCSVFIYHGEKVFIVKGSENNIKITFPEDIVRAEAILKGGQDS